MTLTVKMQDAIRDFLQGEHLPHSAISRTTENARSAVQAGEHCATALALLIGTRFEDVSFDPSPIFAADLSATTKTPWRVSFSWHANQLKEESHDELDDSDDEHDEVGTA
ncbi:hypothetical protein [Mycolicibacterium fortuitum]|uniref:hypothetical protein n=1 Tax=Mycolicibacterium fortuitum TaxID=1766 RepID=UPI0012FF6A8E|nr:hypothetical protein [Mycolicibacterium fortuitum]